MAWRRPFLHSLWFRYGAASFIGFVVGLISLPVVIFVFMIAMMMFGGAVASKVMPLSSHFGFEPPSDLVVLEHDHSQSGIDHSDAFKFSFEKDVFLKRLISRWELSKYDHVNPGSHSRIVSTIDAFHQPAPEWLKVGRLRGAAERYGAMDEDMQTYAYVWIDRSRKELYLVYGDW